MKLTSAKDAARLAAESKALAGEKAAEAAEAKRASARLKRAEAALDKKLSSELLLAAAKGEVNLVWTESSLPLLRLSQRGFLVYEHGTFSDLDIEDRINDWRRHALGAGLRKWIDSPDLVINLTDQRSLKKLFGGAQGFAMLHQSIWDFFTQKILDDEYFWTGHESGLADYAAGDLLTSAVQAAWRTAVRDRDVRPEVSFQSLYDYDEIHGGTMMAEFRREGVRLVKVLGDILTTDRELASNLDYTDSKRLKKLDGWRCDFEGLAIHRLDGAGPTIFEVQVPDDEDDSSDVVGRILNPLTFGLMASLSEVYRKCSPLCGVDSVEVAWLPLKSDWSPIEDVVDAKLLGWLGAEEGRAFLALVSGSIDAAAEEGLTHVEFKMEQRPGHWSMTRRNGLAYASLPPTLVSNLLTGYGYKVVHQQSTKQHRLTVSW